MIALRARGCVVDLVRLPRPRLGRRSPSTPSIAPGVLQNVLMPAMALRSTFSSSVLRQPVFSRGAFACRRAPNWSQSSRLHTHLGSQSGFSRSTFARKLLWIVPVAGGFVLYTASKPRETHNVFASPTLIPCPEPAPEQVEAIIMSPSESDRSLLRRILTFLRERLVEPVLTAKRFVYLCCVFVPVLLAAPMLLIGQPDQDLGGDKWGAVWWYGFLTSQMQRAGPTFIKVSLRDFSPTCAAGRFASSLCILHLL